jgi:hypothetical protein
LTAVDLPVVLLALIFTIAGLNKSAVGFNTTIEVSSPFNLSGVQEVSTRYTTVNKILIFS